MNRFILAVILILTVACNKKSNDHGHEHTVGGLEPLAYTLYSDKTEIFVEFKPLVVGSTSKFAAHFTVLGESFKALTEGSVTVSLIVDGKGIKQTTTQPSVPGIYRLSLKPLKPGKGDLIFDIVTKDFTDRQIIKNVSVYADEKAALADQAEESGGGNNITYLKEQAWKVDFANAPVKKQSFNDVIKTNGQILSAPGDEVIVTAKASGIVGFAGNQTIIGSEVNSGTPLFVISGGDIAEGNVDVIYKETKSNYDKAKSDYDRSTELIKDKIISEKEFQHTKLAYENANTTYQAIAKNYSGKGQTVPSPMNGFVKNIMVAEGQYVTAGTPLVSISKNKRLLLQVNVSQRYFEKLSTITSANFRTMNSQNFASTLDLEGKVVSYGKSASDKLPFIPVTFEVNNTGNLIPGSVAEVYLKSSSIPDALIIPVSSLVEEQGNFFVYVQMEGESFQKREIRTGATDGIYIQVLSGIEEGERVVTKGAYQIKLSTASGTLPAHGHEH